MPPVPVERVSHGKRPARPRRTPEHRKVGHRPARTPLRAAGSIIQTMAAATEEVGRAINGRRHFVLQLPGLAAWPRLPWADVLVYVGIGPHIVCFHDAEVLAQVHTVMAAQGARICGVAVVPKTWRTPLYQTLDLSPGDDDERDILVLDLTDPGPNPLLEAAVTWSDDHPGETDA